MRGLTWFLGEKKQAKTDSQTIRENIEREPDHARDVCTSSSCVQETSFTARKIR